MGAFRRFPADFGCSYGDECITRRGETVAVSASMGVSWILQAPFDFLGFRVGADRVVTWGDPQYGGNCSRVQDQLRNVQQNGLLLLPSSQMEAS